MTVSSTVQKIRYSGNGVTTTFAAPGSFVSSSTTPLEVYLRDETDADAITDTLQTISTHYSISGTNVVMVTAPASDEKLIIRVIIPLTQTIDFGTSDPFPADDNESGLDRILRMVQQLYEMIRRSPKFTTGSATVDINMPEPSASELLGWNTGATAITNYSASDVFGTLLPFTISGTRASPNAITAAGGISASTTAYRQLIYVQGSGGAVDITANPQITASTIDGAELVVVCCSDTNTVTIDHGTGVDANGSNTMGDGDAMHFVYSTGSALWQEISRR